MFGLIKRIGLPLVDWLLNKIIFCLLTQAGEQSFVLSGLIGFAGDGWVGITTEMAQLALLRKSRVVGVVFDPLRHHDLAIIQLSSLEVLPALRVFGLVGLLLREPLQVVVALGRSGVLLLLPILEGSLLSKLLGAPVSAAWRHALLETLVLRQPGLLVDSLELSIHLWLALELLQLLLRLVVPSLKISHGVDQLALLRDQLQPLLLELLHDLSLLLKLLFHGLVVLPHVELILGSVGCWVLKADEELEDVLLVSILETLDDLLQNWEEALLIRDLGQGKSQILLWILGRLLLENHRLKIQLLACESIPSLGHVGCGRGSELAFLAFQRTVLVVGARLGLEWLAGLDLLSHLKHRLLHAVVVG